LLALQTKPSKKTHQLVQIKNERSQTMAHNRSCNGNRNYNRNHNHNYNRNHAAFKTCSLEAVQASRTTTTLCAAGGCADLLC
jgi:hypothetical protein